MFNFFKLKKEETNYCISFQRKKKGYEALMKTLKKKTELKRRLK